MIYHDLVDITEEIHIPYLVVTATIKFSLAQVWLLIEGSSYSMAAFINFGLIPCGTIDNNSSTKDWFLRTILQVIEI